MQRAGIDYEDTYSPMVDIIGFGYLINLVYLKDLECLMDVVIVYPYGLLDKDTYMKIPEGFKMTETCNSSTGIFSLIYINLCMV